MKIAFIIVTLVTCSILLCEGISTNTYFTATDRNNAKKIFLEAIETNDVPSLHFAVLGLKLLEESIPKQAQVCKTLLDAASTSNPTTETLYYVASAYKAIGSCPQALPVMNIVKTLNGVLNSESNVQELYHGLGSLVALNQKPQNVAKLVKAIQGLLKKNDSLANLGYLFHIAANLGAEGAFAFDRIEDAVVQADEVDSKYLQFEGGLSITALIVNGAYKLAQSLNKPPPITAEQSVKYANYFLYRKSVQTPKGMWSLVQALTTLQNNNFHKQVAITLVSSPSVSTEAPKISLKISDVFGGPVGPMNVVADSATRISDNVVVLSKKKFEPVDSTVYTFNMMESKPERGLYKLTISAALVKADPRVPKSIGSSFSIKVMCSAAIDFVDVGTADADQTTQPKLERVQYPTKLGRVLEADTQQKVMMRFTVKDKTATKLISVHQLFVKFTTKAAAGKAEHTVTFVAEHDSALQYKFDLDIGSRAVDFNHVSGLYDVELLVGDPVLSNSFSWKLAAVKLSFTGEPRKDPTNSDLYKPKPVITHVFREPEVRPALFVSNLFSILVSLPLLLLLLLWARLRINVSNMPVSLATVGFHLGLCSIFGLFGLFWLRLNMFQTVKYLIGVGVITFLSGNKLLRRLAHPKK